MENSPTPLTALAAARIRREGPIRVSHFMEMALGHPEFGYYASREPFGRSGDFITAPEISQMFGELLGAWMAAYWRAVYEGVTGSGSSAPAPAAAAAAAPVRVVELGPGRGALMADALRAARAAPGFIENLSLHLIETSPRLRAQQAAALAGMLPESRIHWARDVSQVPAAPGAPPGAHDAPPGADGAPMLLLANEFFDALPIRQFMRAPNGWRERRVGLDNAGALEFVWGDAAPAPPAPVPPALCAAAESAPGKIIEVCPAALRAVFTIAQRLEAHGGAALMIDYGHARSGVGETLQAVRAHTFQHPLSRPGETDLTAHVDFQALAETAAHAGARVYGPIGQGAFLERLGIGARADALAANAPPAQREAVAAARTRLTGAGPGEMGALFKVLCLTGPHDPPPPGFED